MMEEVAAARPALSSTTTTSTLTAELQDCFDVLVVSEHAALSTGKTSFSERVREMMEREREGERGRARETEWERERESDGEKEEERGAMGMCAYNIK